MAIDPCCINATIAYLGEEEDMVPAPPGSWRRTVRTKVDVYRCLACGHLERVPKAPKKDTTRNKPLRSLRSALFVILLVVYLLLPSSRGTVLVLVILQVAAAVIRLVKAPPQTKQAWFLSVTDLLSLTLLAVWLYTPRGPTSTLLLLLMLTTMVLNSLPLVILVPYAILSAAILILFHGQVTFWVIFILLMGGVAMSVVFDHVREKESDKEFNEAVDRAMDVLFSPGDTKDDKTNAVDSSAKKKTQPFPANNIMALIVFLMLLVGAWLLPFQLEERYLEIIFLGLLLPFLAWLFKTQT